MTKEKKLPPIVGTGNPKPQKDEKIKPIQEQNAKDFDAILYGTAKNN